jgi:hypothetical protein
VAAFGALTISAVEQIGCNHLRSACTQLLGARTTAHAESQVVAKGFPFTRS